MHRDAFILFLSIHRDAYIIFFLFFYTVYLPAGPPRISSELPSSPRLFRNSNLYSGRERGGNGSIYSLSPLSRWSAERSGK